MSTTKNDINKIIVFFVILISYIAGYILRENAVGGGVEFYELDWPITQSFKRDFLFTIQSYGSFGDGTIPFSHIINAYLNPFSNNVETFQLSVVAISFVIFLVFAFILKKIFSYINTTDILLLSSILLILPFFRTSAFWGKNENYGWLFFILALYFFSEIKKNIYEAHNDKNLKNVLFFCFTSSCALYARQALIFLPISYFLFLFLNKVNKKIILTSVVWFTLFSIPGLLLIFTWGGLYDMKNVNTGTVYGLWVHHEYILKNLPILTSFFGFYLLPILIIEFFNYGYKDFFKKYSKSFFLALTTLIILSQINLLDYLGTYVLSGGAILKLNYLIMKNNFFLLLIFSAIGFSILIRFIKEDPKNNAIILVPLVILYSLPRLLYQEYAEPLILIIFFMAIKTDLHKVYFKKVSVSNTIFLSYFAVYLIGSIYFKHFAFDTLEKWKFFLN